MFRRALSWLPAQLTPHSAPVDTPRQFGSTEHLSIEAVAAFVDGELQMNAHLRAAQHLSQCSECAGEVDDQSRARAALRDSQPIRIPGNLLGTLSQIPHSPSSADDDAPPGPSEQSDQFPEGGTRDRRKRR